jgi:hypothetical protein
MSCSSVKYRMSYIRRVFSPIYLPGMKPVKSLGTDGFTSEFFKFFWNSFGKFVFRSMNYGLMKKMTYLWCSHSMTIHEKKYSRNHVRRCRWYCDMKKSMHSHRYTALYVFVEQYVLMKKNKYLTRERHTWKNAIENWIYMYISILRQ